MIGKTLGFYISMRFLRMLFAMVIGLGFLIVSVDFIEQLRKAAAVENVSLGSLYLISLLRAPAFIEKAFPFACLFAAMITLTQLNSKMELVVARASGVSAWQFLLPISISAAFIGILVTILYNPLAIYAFKASEDLTAEVLVKNNKGKPDAQKAFWIKQLENDGGTTIINAELARNRGQLLNNAKIIRFDKNGNIVERIDAAEVRHTGQTWQITEATLVDLEGTITTQSRLEIATNLSEDELLGGNLLPETVSFWELREVAETVEKSGTNANPFWVQYHSLTALPMFLVAMVLIAATVCLKFVRFGQVGKMILGGIMGGFVLYTVTSLVIALGSNGVVPPVVAAWSPGIVAILFGMSSLLHQEDG